MGVEISFRYSVFPFSTALSFFSRFHPSPWPLPLNLVKITQKRVTDVNDCKAPSKMSFFYYFLPLKLHRIPFSPPSFSPIPFSLSLFETSVCCDPLSSVASMLVSLLLQHYRYPSSNSPHSLLLPVLLISRG